MQKKLKLILTGFAVLISLSCSKNKHPEIFCMIGSEEFNALSDTWKSQYTKELLHYEGRGNATGPKGLLEGVCEMAAMTRPMSDPEFDKILKSTGKKPLALPVAIEAIAIVSHKNIKKTALSHENVISIFTGGMLDSFPQITVYGVNSASDRYRFFKETVLKGNKITDRIQEISGPLQLVDNVSQTENSFGYARPEETTSEIKILGIIKDGSIFYPEKKTVRNGKYPYARYYYIYITEQKPSEKTIEFLKYVLSSEGQKSLLPHGLYPISEKVRQETLQKIKLLN
ncbi:MAG: substrate-binding domain-containing protein [Spirochaetia bacterium]|nr:substrate-binding domain-containing protein [Spirochaetia bacterium]